MGGAVLLRCAPGDTPLATPGERVPRRGSPLWSRGQGHHPGRAPEEAQVCQQDGAMYLHWLALASGRGLERRLL
eukprot:11827037-Heterocapsa_arctica.AAC.1